MVNHEAFNYYTRLKRVKLFVEQNLCGVLSLKLVAEVAGLEEKYFSTFFHDKTGVRFNEWVNRLRIERAMQMFRRRNHAISVVAFSAGYRDLRTFERAFKRVTGMTPRAYKKSVKPGVHAQSDLSAG